MKTWRFTVSLADEEGFNVEIQGLITPPVQAASFWDAIYSPEVTTFCEVNKVTVYKVVE